MKSTNLIQSSIALLLFSGILLSSCSTPMRIERPKESYVATPLTPSTSEIPLKLEIDIKALEASLNKKLNGLIYEGSNLGDQDLAVKVWKAQDFSFRIQGNTIDYKVPLKVWSRFSWQLQRFGISMGDNYEASGTIALSYRTTLLIDKNWKLVTKTESTGYQWIEAPKLNVGGVGVPLKNIADIVLVQSDKKLTAQLDKSMNEMVKIKEYIQPTWSQLQTPMLLSPENQLWLKLTPKEFYMSPLKSENNKLQLSFALYTQIETSLGAKPAATNAMPLPDFKYVNRPPSNFSINLPTIITYEKIAELSKQQVLNKTFSQGRNKITITDLNIFGSNGKMVVEATVTGSIKSKIYFEGVPEFDATTNTLRIANPEFDLSTRNVLAKSANWMLHGFLLKQITPFLSYNLTKDLQMAKDEANKMISSYKLAQGVQLKGALTSIEVKNVALIPGAIRVETNTKGNIGIQITELEF